MIDEKIGNAWSSHRWKKTYSAKTTGNTLLILQHVHTTLLNFLAVKKMSSRYPSSSYGLGLDF